MTNSWLLAFHVIGIILWMGGLFQLTRHLGMSAELGDSDVTAELQSYESKTYYMAVLPGMLLTLATGIWALTTSPGMGVYMDADGSWGGTFHMKLTLVAILLGIDQFVHFKMRKLHGGADVGRGTFMAAHGTTGLLFIVIVVIIQAGVLMN